MKIQLDYDTKTITLVDDVKLKEFFNKIKTLLPDWKDWNLNAQTVINWNNPIRIPYYPDPTPWWLRGTWVTTGAVVTLDGDCNTVTDGVVTDITSGVYNLEVN
jgi:hypothetical protein